MQIANGSTPKIGFILVDATDNETKEPGLTPTVLISKNGGAFAAATNAAVEVPTSTYDGLGFYTVTLTASETDTDGPLMIAAYATGTNMFRDIHYVETVEDVTLSSAEKNSVADHMWRRNFDNVEASSDGDTLDKQSGIGALAQLVNVVSQSGATITIKKADGTTTFYTMTAETDPDAAPVIGLS